MQYCLTSVGMANVNKTEVVSEMRRAQKDKQHTSSLTDGKHSLAGPQNGISVTRT